MMLHDIVLECSLAYRGYCVPDPTAISEKPRSGGTIEFLAPLG